MFKAFFFEFRCKLFLLQECQCKGMDCTSEIKGGWGNGSRCQNKWNNAGCFYDGGDCCKDPTSNSCKDDLAKAKASAAAGRR